MEKCPAREELQRLNSEKVDPEDRAALETHISHCEACQQTLSELNPGPTQEFVAPLKSEAGAASGDSLPDELRDHPRYKVVSILGRGGMGTVYRAEHRLLERPVVLKVIRPDILDKPGVLQRFQREAKLAARLTHPNIVAVYEAEDLGATQLLVMEFIEGLDFADLVSQRGLLPVAETCELIRQAALGLQHIHEQHLVHRDIKPANLLVSSDGVVKILDLGLATLKGEQKLGGDLTSDGQFLGTVDFASPEQWESTRDVDIRSDVYILGCTFYYLLAGQSPFPSSKYSTTMQQMWAHSQVPLPPIRELRQDVPEGIQEVLKRMTAKNPDERFTSPSEIAEALEPFVQDCSLTEFVRTARRTTTSRIDLSKVTSASLSKGEFLPQPQRRGSRRTFGVAAAVLGLAAILMVGFAFLRSGGDGKSSNGEPLPTSGGSRPGDVLLPTGTPIKVGVLHSRTGTMAISERPVIDATLLAIEEINESGGVLGRPVEAIVEDGQSDWPTFAAKAEKLIAEDQVCAIFGCWTSASRKTVLPVLKKYDHLLFYPVQYEGLEESPNIVYTGAAPNQQIIPAIRWCSSVLKKNRFFLVGSDYVFPRCANAIIRDTVADLNGEVVGEEYLLLGDSNVSGIIEKIVEAKPDVILNTINGDSNIAFFRSLRSAGITSEETPTISFSIAEQELSNLSNKDIVGDYAAWNYFHTVDRPQNQAFIERFQARYGSDRLVSDPMEAAYIAVYLWAGAVKEAGSIDVQAIRQAVKQQEFDAPGGTVRVDPQTQHLSKVFRVGRITPESRFDVIYSSDSPMAPMPYPNTRNRAEWDSFLLDLNLGWGGQWANPGQ